MSITMGFKLPHKNGMFEVTDKGTRNGQDNTCAREDYPREGLESLRGFLASERIEICPDDLVLYKQIPG